mmetsp:Transcript_94497/g.282120  ORF Transcript_94497/g.282120 Transcript_94497/m.282120 type:complete len:631 (+) Transcript_94497:48-1940(+)
MSSPERECHRRPPRRMAGIPKDAAMEYLEAQLAERGPVDNCLKETLGGVFCVCSRFEDMSSEFLQVSRDSRTPSPDSSLRLPIHLTMSSPSRELTSRPCLRPPRQDADSRARSRSAQPPRSRSASLRTLPKPALRELSPAPCWSPSCSAHPPPPVPPSRCSSLAQLAGVTRACSPPWQAPRSQLASPRTWRRLSPRVVQRSASALQPSLGAAQSPVVRTRSNSASLRSTLFACARGSPARRTSSPVALPCLPALARITAPSASPPVTSRWQQAPPTNDLATSQASGSARPAAAELARCESAVFSNVKVSSAPAWAWMSAASQAAAGDARAAPFATAVVRSPSSVGTSAASQAGPGAPAAPAATPASFKVGKPASVCARSSSAWCLQPPPAAAASSRATAAGVPKVIALARSPSVAGQRCPPTARPARSPVVASPRCRSLSQQERVPLALQQSTPTVAQFWHDRIPTQRSGTPLTPLSQELRRLQRQAAFAAVASKPSQPGVEPLSLSSATTAAYQVPGDTSGASMSVSWDVAPDKAEGSPGGLGAPLCAGAQLPLPLEVSSAPRGRAPLQSSPPLPLAGLEAPSEQKPEAAVWRRQLPLSAWDAKENQPPVVPVAVKTERRMPLREREVG